MREMEEAMISVELAKMRVLLREGEEKMRRLPLPSVNSAQVQILAVRRTDVLLNLREFNLVG